MRATQKIRNVASQNSLISRFVNRVRRNSPPTGTVFDVSRPRNKTFAAGSFRDISVSHRGFESSKWDHYLDIYQLWFEPFRVLALTREIGVVEIGVAQGGSLEILSNYLGGKAKIVGIDIKSNPNYSELNKNISVVLGDQKDHNVLAQALNNIPSLDLVIDDGSHVSEDQIATFEYLWPRLADGGLYLVEDLHCAYWPEFSGGFRKRTSFVEYLKALIDEQHGWYHRAKSREPVLKIKESLHSICFHDSIVALRKETINPPQRIVLGGVGREVQNPN